MFGTLQWRSSKLIRTVKIAARVGVLAAGVYGTGYYAGVTEYISNPKVVEKAFLKELLLQNGATQILPVSSKETRRVSRIVQRMIPAAQELCAQELALSMKEYVTKYGETFESTIENESFHDADLGKRLHIDGIKALLNGHSAVEGRWTVAVIDSPHPNAFVVETFPKKIFICQGLLDICQPNDEELALIIAHEMSHLIHFHGSQRLASTAIVNSIQLVLLAVLDPLGISSIMWEAMAWIVSKSFSASFSRQHESQADITGIKIASRACYDTRKGALIFDKLSRVPGSRQTTHWSDAHPSSPERLQLLSELSKNENWSKHVHCYTLLRSLERIGIRF